MPRLKLHPELLTALINAPIRLAPSHLARFNNARLHYPTRVYHGAGGIGDDLLCTCVFRELRKRGQTNIVVRSWHRDIFRGNLDVDIVIRKKLPLFATVMIHGLNMYQLDYSVPLKEHFLATMCRKAGVTGEAALRPYVYLRAGETAAGRLFERQIVIQSSGLGATVPMKNKEWFPERFQTVADAYRTKASLIQLGTPLDPLLKGALDLRGKTSLRQAAAILANSLVFIGQVGFLMHLARAVECRAVIVYGGRETPATTGYIANKNVVGITTCSPCWEENKCDYHRECMNMISASMVIKAVADQLARHGEPLETEIAFL